MKRLKVVNVVGARLNFMKIAPIHAEMQRFPEIDAFLLHTGQQYDHTMSTLFFESSGLPETDFYLGVGSGDHGVQTGRVMIEFEPVLKELAPDLVVVVGDVNSTIACALVATKMGCHVAHVEAGLRSFDCTMPEEINRLLTDQISDYLFTTEPSARGNLQREGIPEDKIHFVGNVMIDLLLRHRRRAAERPVLARLGVEPRSYVLVTLHHPYNVDDPVRNRLEKITGIWPW
jgi:UDP-N-acetylglucosamine 2-epimerase (non-hydrolysing)